MKVCPVCNTLYPNEDNFCEKDGSPLEYKNGKKCPNCGMILNEHAKFCSSCSYSFVDGKVVQKEKIPDNFVLIDDEDGKPFYMGKFPVTQEMYMSVTDENPSDLTGDKKPVVNVSWYDAIRFCNLLSEKEGKSPVYFVNGKSDVKCWNYIPHQGNVIDADIKMDERADGYRLPTNEEWQWAAAGGDSFSYAGSDEIEDVAWYSGNSDSMIHDVGQKKVNGYGLSDMSGNVWEWCWDFNFEKKQLSPAELQWNFYMGQMSRVSDKIIVRSCCGGSKACDAENCELYNNIWIVPESMYSDLGFRLVYKM